MLQKQAKFIVAAAVLTFACAGTSSAKTYRSEVNITKATGVSGGGVDVRGNVRSARKCKKSRRVKVYHDVDPAGPSSMDFFLGSTVTNKRGKWRLSTELEPDKVRAVVVGKKRGRHRCKPAKSQTVPVT